MLWLVASNRLRGKRRKEPQAQWAAELGMELLALAFCAHHVCTGNWVTC